MSERWSYDYHPRGGRFPTGAEVDACASVGLRPVRTVIWRDEWPAQEDVPHVGETVWVAGSKRPHVVLTTPFDGGLGRCMVITRVSDGSSWGASSVDQISRTPPTKRYRVKLRLSEASISEIVHATDEADAIAKAVTVEEVDDD